MKLFHKIFLCFIVIFGAAFQMAGYLLINFAYGNAMGQEKKLAFQEFQYNRYILQSILYSQPDFFSEKDGEIHHFDLCESCYDDWVNQFKIAVEVEEQTEYL